MGDALKAIAVIGAEGPLGDSLKRTHDIIRELEPYYNNRKSFSLSKYGFILPLPCLYSAYPLVYDTESFRELMKALRLSLRELWDASLESIGMSGIDQYLSGLTAFLTELEEVSCLVTFVNSPLIIYAN